MNIHEKIIQKLAQLDENELTNEKPNEIKKENILTGLKKIDSYFGPGWEKSYATLDLGKVKIQTHKSILEKNFKYMDDIKKCLENN